MTEFAIYEYPNYDVKTLAKNGRVPKAKAFKGTINAICKQLEKNKGYHLLLPDDDKQNMTLYFDLDHMYEPEILFDFIEDLTTLLFEHEFPISSADDVKFTLSVKRNCKYMRRESKDSVGVPELRTEYSSHITVPKIHGSYDVIRNLTKQIMEKDLVGLSQYIDDSVYRHGGIFRLPGQTNADKQFVHEIIEGDMKDFILSYIPKDSMTLRMSDDYEKKREKVKRKKERMIEDLQKIDDVNYDVSDEDLVKLLDGLDDKYLDCYPQWNIITCILKKMNKYNIWNTWSKQSSHYDKKKNDDIWKNRKPKHLLWNINFLVHISTYKVCKEYIPLTTSISNTVTMNHKYLSDADIGFQYEQFVHNKTIVLKSVTGLRFQKCSVNTQRNIRNI